MNNPRHQQPRQPSEFDEKVLQIRRVSRKTKGGNRISFTALVIVGNKKGRVGVGLGKGPDVQSAIGKGSRLAKRDMVDVPLRGDTIPHLVNEKFGAAKVLLKPAPDGSGVIAGGSVRAVVEAAGIRNIVGKILGNNNKMSNVYATLGALRSIQNLAAKHAHLKVNKSNKK